MISKVTVGIVCHNEEKNIDACLASLFAEENLALIDEVIVVDNDSTDGTPGKLQDWAERFPLHLRVLHSKENLLGLARQTIVDRCQSALLAFTDADCVVPGDWLPQLLQNFQAAEAKKDRLAGICGPNRLPECQYWQLVINRFLSHPLGHGNSPQALIPKSPKRVNHLPTTNALYKLSALRETEGFKKNLMVGEDAQIGKELEDLHYDMILFPTPVVINKCAETFNEWLSRMWRFGSAQWIHSPKRAALISGLLWCFLAGIFYFSFHVELVRHATLGAFSLLVFVWSASKNDWAPYHGALSFLAYLTGLLIRGPVVFLKNLF